MNSGKSMSKGDIEEIFIKLFILLDNDKNLFLKRSNKFKGIFNYCNNSDNSKEIELILIL